MARWRTFLPRISQTMRVDNMTLGAAAFAMAWMDLLGERAYIMRSDARLIEAAQWQAYWLAAHDFNEGDPHRGEDGSTANERVRQVGYTLPSFWPERGNQVESVTRSWATPMQAARDLAAHDTHRDHMMVQEWYVKHVCYGVGNCGSYYVVVTAPVETGEVR